MRADTRLPPYLPYPRFLLQTDLTQTAMLLYALLLDRATPSPMSHKQIRSAEYPASHALTVASIK